MRIGGRFGLTLTALPLAVVLVGCPGGPTGPTGVETGPLEELIGPVVVHEVVSGPIIAGTAVDISVNAVDEDDGVFRVSLFYRTVEEPVFETLFLDVGENGDYTGTIPGVQVEAPGLEYYVRAEDDSNFRVETFAPE
ncbi:MAG: hypothetical protein ACJARS_001409, partial [bacterium]